MADNEDGGGGDAGSSSSDSSTVPPWRKEGSGPPPAVVSASGSASGTEDSDEPIPEWKKKFQTMKSKSRSPSSSPRTAKAKAAEKGEKGEEEVPEWMAKFQKMKAKQDEGGQSDMEASAHPPPPQKAEEEKEMDPENMPEWMRKRMEMQSKHHVEPASADDSGNIPEWKKKLQGMKQKEAASEPTTPVTDQPEQPPRRQSAAVDNIPEWKRKLQEMKQSQHGAGDAQEAAASLLGEVNQDDENEVTASSQHDAASASHASAASGSGQQDSASESQSSAPPPPPSESGQLSEHPSEQGAASAGGGSDPAAPLGAPEHEEEYGEEEVYEEVIEEYVDENGVVIHQVVMNPVEGSTAGSAASQPGVIESEEVIIIEEATEEIPGLSGMPPADGEDEYIVEEVSEAEEEEVQKTEAEKTRRASEMMPLGDDEEEMEVESSAPTPVSHNLVSNKSGDVVPPPDFTSIAPAPAPDDEALSYAQVHRPIPQPPQGGQPFQPNQPQSSFSVYRPPGRGSQTSIQTSQTSIRTVVPRPPGAPDPQGDHSEEGDMLRIEPEGRVSIQQDVVEVTDEEALVLNAAWEHELQKGKDSVSAKSSSAKSSRSSSAKGSRGSSTTTSEEPELVSALAEAGGGRKDEAGGEEGKDEENPVPEQFEDEEQPDKLPYAYQDEQRRWDDSPLLMGLICMLFLGLIAAAIVLILALLELPPFEPEETPPLTLPPNFPTPAPTREFVGNEPTTPMAPYIPGQCPVPGQIQPNILSQCECDGRISSIEPDVRAKYEALRDSFVSRIYPGWSYPIDSCEDENKALLFLATGYQIDETDLLQRYTLALTYYATDGPRWRSDQNWLSDADVCTWYGIACTNDLVAIFALEENRVSGSVSNAYDTLQMWAHCHNGTNSPGFSLNVHT